MEKRNHWRPNQNGELLESEIWDVMEERRVVNEPEVTSIGLLSKQLQSSARLIPMEKKNQVHGSKLFQHSAPVNIPNWSKLNSSKNSSFDGSSHGCFNDDEDDEGCRLPPHEWLARKEKMSRVLSFSVCEGVGRTLKGRDQSTVRHAVLTKTGFI